MARLLAVCGAMGEHQRVDADVQTNLRYLLNEWDFLDVAGAVSDEYDCMIAPLLTRLGEGADRAGISEYLWYELQDHFGVDPMGYEVDRMADRLVAWWAVVSNAATQ